MVTPDARTAARHVWHHYQQTKRCGFSREMARDSATMLAHMYRNAMDEHRVAVDA